MRTSQLATTYISAFLFSLVGLRTFLRWRRDRVLRQAHMALATGLFGLGQIVSAISSTLYDATKAEVAPHWLSAVSGTITYLAIFAFLVFLSDFIPVPSWAFGIAAVVTLFFIVLASVEQPDLRFDPEKGLVPIPGIDNPIGFRAYLWMAIGYLAATFGILWIAFAVYGVRVHGLARFRMLSIAAGFLLIFLAIGLIPLLLFGNPTATTITNVGNVIRYLALGSAPLLFLGFAPPGFVTRRFAQPVPAQGQQRAV